MLAFIARRLLALPFVLFGVSILIFGITQFLPPDVRATAYIRSEKQLGQLQEIVKQYGLDKDPFTQYWGWLNNAFQGNFGYSTQARQPVLDALLLRLPATIELALCALIPTLVLGVLFGIVSGVNRNKWPDQLGRFFSTISFSLPTFVVGIFFLAIFYGQYRIAPSPGRYDVTASLDSGLTSFDGFLIIPTLIHTLLNSETILSKDKWLFFKDLLAHLVLPVITLTIVLSGSLTRVVRSSVIDQLEQDYVRTARSKGLPSRVVTFKHILRNALIPVITLSGTLLIGLLGGSIITETVFNFPGIGNYAAQAAVNNDRPAVLGFALFSAVVTVLINLVVDLLYGVVDPRIRYD